MLKRVVLLSSIAVAVMAAYVLQTVAADKAEKGFKATCPVSGKPAKEDSSLRHMGKKVYFCCANCPKAYKADRKKFLTKANQQLVETGQVVQVCCPLTGRPADKSKTAKIGATQVALCCGNCLGKVESAADQVAFVFANKTFRKGFTLQNTCPVSGKPIVTEHSVTHNSKKVYFCCPNCPKAFESNPDKYTGKLPQFKVRKKKAKKKA